MADKDLTVYDPIDKESAKGKILEVRGCRVMLDKDIADFFGVETGALNRAMKRNIRRFPELFCFQLNRDEYMDILRCQSGILELEQGKYSKYLPYVYTEQGVAMLTSVLHTDRAISASVQIIEAFVEMTHYLRDNDQLMTYDELNSLEVKHYRLADRVQSIEENMITRDDLSKLMRLFDERIESRELLILNGEPFKADVVYQNIYRKARKNIIIMDDYLGVKTLQHLAHAREDVDITIISDNKGYNRLRRSEYEDFRIEYPGIQIRFIKNMKNIHDRYIVVDYGTKAMTIYHCGSSSKDAGGRITTITEINEIGVYKDAIKSLLGNPQLVLK